MAQPLFDSLKQTPLTTGGRGEGRLGKEPMLVYIRRPDSKVKLSEIESLKVE